MPFGSPKKAQRYIAENPSFGSLQQALLAVELMEPAAISDAMVYLCGESGRYITGITLPVDAGMVAE